MDMKYDAKAERPWDRLLKRVQGSAQLLPMSAACSNLVDAARMAEKKPRDRAVLRMWGGVLRDAKSECDALSVGAPARAECFRYLLESKNVVERAIYLSIRDARKLSRAKAMTLLQYLESRGTADDLSLLRQVAWPASVTQEQIARVRDVLKKRAEEAEMLVLLEEYHEIVRRVRIGKAEAGDEQRLVEVCAKLDQLEILEQGASIPLHGTRDDSLLRLESILDELAALVEKIASRDGSGGIK